MERGAAFSPCWRYRYALWRIWDEGRPVVLFVCLNPSTADEARDDPTVRRCIGYARAWGFGGLRLVNLFALRATDPAALRRADDPAGPENDRWIARMAEGARLVVLAWGNEGRGRGPAVRALLPDPHGLRLTRSGQPAHPLYLPASLVPVPVASLPRAGGAERQGG